MGFIHTADTPAGTEERPGQQDLLFSVTSESEWSPKQTDFIHNGLDIKAEGVFLLEIGPCTNPRMQPQTFPEPGEGQILDRNIHHETVPILYQSSPGSSETSSHISTLT